MKRINQSQCQTHCYVTIYLTRRPILTLLPGLPLPREKKFDHKMRERGNDQNKKLGKKYENLPESTNKITKND